MAKDEIIRKPLLTAAAINKEIKKVEVKEINFKPGQQTGYHLHPCPVVGYIAEGTCTFQVEGGPLQTLKAGDAFYEPANTPMKHFDNASTTEPMKFICFYLMDNETEVIKMLDK